MGGPARDRTADFEAVCSSLKSRQKTTQRKQVNAVPLRSVQATKREQAQPLLDPSHQQQALQQPPIHNKTDFTRKAALISRNIQATAGKLERLTTLAKKKSLFDDRPVEIQELTHVIKQDIANLSAEINHLQQYQQSTSGATNRQNETHGQNVLGSLKSKLANATTRFKDVLEIRTQTMKAQKERKEQFSFAPTQTNMASSQLVLSFRDVIDTDASTGSSLYNPQHVPSGPEEGAPFQQQQQQQMVMQPPNEMNYVEERSAAFETIESTVQELASIFTQMGTLIAQQKEQIGRIDQDIDDIEANVSGGQQQLLRYMNNISSNRWLLIKVFAVLIVFIILWSVVA